MTQVETGHGTVMVERTRHCPSRPGSWTSELDSEHPYPGIVLDRTMHEGTLGRYDGLPTNGWGTETWELFPSLNGLALTELVGRARLGEEVQVEDTWNDLALFLAKVSQKEVMLRDERGNRTYARPCGCYGSSGGGAYGTTGTAWADYPCYLHNEQ